MPTTYKFAVDMQVDSLLPRDRITNTFHMEHVTGGLLDTDLEAMCQDVIEMYQARYGIANRHIRCTAYDTDAVPNYPRAQVEVNSGSAWVCVHPREIALCLSFAGPHRGIKDQRGRLYLMPSIAAGGLPIGVRPTTPDMQWALNFYEVANQSFPDLGGVDWKFGVYSPTYKHFTQTTQAWVDDEWDTQRRRGLRETTRLSVARDG